ncbi:MAG TPA: peptide deformylase [Nocardioidaceae bacterium]|nr:peptide deformylase [Nocardioidaceae bacterium]
MTSLPAGGNVRPIVRWGAAVLHRPLKDVEVFGDELAALVADMAATMQAADGVGLAANQVGVDLKVFVFDCPDESGTRQQGVVCNPVLELPEGRDRRLDEDDEGCLSLPGAFQPCARPDFATVTGVDHTGAPVTYQGDGLLARCLQHETDHLFGRVFGDRLGKRARRKLYKEAEAAADDFPVGWPADKTAATP